MFGSSHTHKRAVSADIAANIAAVAVAVAVPGLTVTVPATCWIVGKGLRPSYGEGCLIGFTFVVVVK